MELFPRHRPVARRLLRLTPIALLLAWAGCAVEKDCGCEEGWVETSASPGHVSSEAVPAGSAVAPDEPADDSHPGATRFAPGAPRDARRGYVAVVEGREVPAPEIAMGDPETIRRILAEGKHRNRVMDHLTYLSAQIGPRLTGSSNAERANRWTAEQFHSWGLSNVHLDEWGTIPVRFDRGPSTGKALVKLEREQDGRQVTEYKPLRDLVFTTHAWAAGTQGPTRGPVVRLPQTEEELAALKDKLPGAWVLIRPAPMAQQSGMRAAGGMGPRYTHRAELRQKAAEPGFDPATLTIEDRVLLAGPAGYISTPRDDQDRVWTTSVPKWRELDPARIPTDIEVSVRLSDYDYLNSRLGDGEELYAEFDLPHTFTPGPIPVYNTVAEIPGTTWPDEVVIVSAHLDSWNGPGSMGTTDNDTGSSVTL
ncbi:MAG TPA: M28 family peptidase, partial [Phycisphaerales bacterium]|nr:M28 family peptidase [Phycisphaerales bacterium]